jgi:hypothetical protein
VLGEHGARQVVGGEERGQGEQILGEQRLGADAVQGDGPG